MAGRPIACRDCGRMFHFRNVETPDECPDCGFDAEYSNSPYWYNEVDD